MKLQLKKRNKAKMPRKKILSYKQVYYLVYIAGFAALIFSGNFIYNNYYQIITEAEEVADLRTLVSPDSIDINKVNNVLAKIDQKTTSTEAILITPAKNPFDQTQPPPPATIEPEPQQEEPEVAPEN